MSEQTTLYIINVNGHIDTNEPLDRLDNRDRTTILKALDIHYKNMLDCGGSLRDLEHLAALSRRLASVDRTWVAEEVAG